MSFTHLATPALIVASHVGSKNRDSETLVGVEVAAAAAAATDRNWEKMRIAAGDGAPRWRSLSLGSSYSAFG